MAQMSVEEILMTYLPLEEDARELVDLYYRVSPMTILGMGQILLPFSVPSPSLYTPPI